MKFTKGLKDGLPVALGYLPVAFAYAIQAVDKGFPFWFPILVSGTNFTGTGQFAGTNLIAAGASLGLLFATMLVINIRYCLMSVSLSQKTGDFPLWQRAVVAFGVTDENYAVAIRQPQKLTFPYLLGLMGCSFAGWLGGTALGAGLSEVLAAVLSGETGQTYYAMIMSAFGISLYAMFVAIIVPPARGDRRLLLLIVLSVGASCLFYFIPALHSLPAGVDIIVCSLACTALIARLFPHAPDGQSGEDGPSGARPARTSPAAAEEAETEAPGAEAFQGEAPAEAGERPALREPAPHEAETTEGKKAEAGIHETEVRAAGTAGPAEAPRGEGGAR